MYRLRSLAGTDNRLFGEQRVRLLRIYLSATTFLFAYGVIFTIFPIRDSLTYADPTGGIIAIVLGLATLAYLQFNPRRLLAPTMAAIVATPIVMAFHNSIAAEYACLAGPVFLAMYLRAFHPPAQAWLLIGFLVAACTAAVAIAPAPKTGFITFLIMTIVTIGAAESFGLLMRSMLAAACTDPMTGLLNRAGWEIATTDVLSSARSHPGMVTVIALDIDNLKELNDTWGHQAGDRRIIEYALHWRRIAPQRAVIARLGGDEFAACIVNAQTGDIEKFLRRIQQDTPGVSIGAATQPLRDVNITKLYAQADAALYRRRGKPLRGETGSSDHQH